MRSKVALLLFLVLIITSLVPAGTVFYFFKEMISSQEKIYKNQRMENIFNDYASTLKQLSKLDPQNEQKYKESFSKIQDQKLIYGSDNFFSDLIKKTLAQSFLVYLIISLATSLLLGITISLYINKIYVNMFTSLAKEKERSNYLNEIAKWQDVARTLAHEVKKPLQPIRLWLSNLNNIDRQNISNDTNNLLNEAVSSIDVEIKNLSSLMDDFKEFSVLPKPKITKTEINSFINEFLLNYKSFWENISFLELQKIENTFVDIDIKLMRNVFVNLIDNASEANPDTPINFSLKLFKKDENVFIDIFNTGAQIPPDNIEKIFEINYSTKNKAKNMGLGLTIVKTIILEHGGNVECLNEKSGARFLINLPTHKGS